MNFGKIVNIFIIFILIQGCSKLQKELPEPTSPSLIHSVGWVDTSSSNFHGRYLKSINWKNESCVQCHASDYSGGTSKVSCYNCHKSYPHRSGWKQVGNVSFHGNFLKNDNWDLISCGKCHGANYDGGSITDISCMTSGCHVDSAQNKKSPESCNTCHGSFSAPYDLVSSWAPPKSIDGFTDSTHRTVGAHSIHLFSGKIGKPLKCAECHNVPNKLYTNGHVDSGPPAEVIMLDTLARLVTASGTNIPNPTYDNVNSKCSNTYCHGDWKLRRATSSNPFGYSDSVMVGAKYSPYWVGGATEAQCGSCHGLPPLGHIASNLNACANCHTGVINNQGVITDKTKHINGKINVFNQEKWMN